MEVEVEDFDFRRQLLSVHGKGDKYRVIPLSSMLLVYTLPRIAEVKGAGRLVEFTDSGARRAITRLAKKAGLKAHVASHDMRATFATGALNSGANIRVVQELLGHASVSTTQIYTGVDEAAMREAVMLGIDD